MPQRLAKHAFIIDADKGMTADPEVQQVLRNADIGDVGQVGLRDNAAVLRRESLLAMALFRLQRKWESLRGYDNEVDGRVAHKNLSSMIQNMHEVIVGAEVGHVASERDLAVSQAQKVESQLQQARHEIEQLRKKSKELEE